MARIEYDKIEKVERNARVHDIVKCDYSIFQDDEGNKYFQMETYGSEGRKFPDMPNQHIQFDAKTAEKLVEIFIRELGVKIQY